MLDLVALTGLEWLYDVVETRHGPAAAWVATLTAAAVILGALVWILIEILNR